MELFKREKYLKKIRGFYHEDDLIKVITGVRRCGKSSLMKIIADEILASGVKKENIIFIDLDSREHSKIKNDNELDKLIENLSKAKGKKYLFIDEVQNVKNFEEVLNGYRTDGDYSIFITGSNSYLLSGELMTKLTGRYLEFEMFPLSFDEYEEMKKFYNKTINPNTILEFNNYILEGCFPRSILIDSLQDKRKYLQDIVKEIFEKDIKKRVHIRNIDTFNIVTKFIINNFGSTTSVHNMCKSLRANNVLITKETLVKYIQALIDAKILYECQRFDMKSKKTLRGEKKYYIVDLGFYYANNTDNQIQYSGDLENMLYFYARSHDYSVSVGRIGKLECDFILRDINMDYSYVQVAYTIASGKETEDREYRPLEQIKDNYPKYVMTTDYLLQKRNGIKHENIIEFMKGNRKF